MKGWWRNAAGRTNGGEEKQHSGGEDNWHAHGPRLIGHWWGFKTAAHIKQSAEHSFDGTSLSHKSAVGQLPIRIKGEFCSGDISLPRQSGIAIQRSQHNEKDSSHEVISVARSAASDAQQEVGMRRMETGAVGAAKHPHIRPTQWTSSAFLLTNSEVSSLTGYKRQNVNVLPGFIHRLKHEAKN